MEQWRPISGWDGYEVSDQGRVRSWRRPGGCRGEPGTWLRRSEPKILSTRLRGRRPGKCGNTVTVSLGSKYNKIVARLVLRAFVGNPPEEKPFALHENDDPTDNRLSNLRWGSPLENADDARRNGRVPSTICACPNCGTSVLVVRTKDYSTELRAA